MDQYLLQANDEYHATMARAEKELKKKKKDYENQKKRREREEYELSHAKEIFEREVCEKDKKEIYYKAIIKNRRKREWEKYVEEEIVRLAAEKDTSRKNFGPCPNCHKVIKLDWHLRDYGMGETYSCLKIKKPY